MAPAMQGLFDNLRAVGACFLFLFCGLFVLCCSCSFAVSQVVLFDRHFDGPFYDLIQTAFSPTKPLRRIGSYGGGLVRFDRLVWHLESPAGIVFPKVGGPAGLMRCHGSTLWGQFRAHVLQRYLHIMRRFF